MYLISLKDNIGTMTNFTTDFSWFLSVWIFTLSNIAFIISVSGPKVMTWETCVSANQDELKNLNHIFYKMKFNFIFCWPGRKLLRNRTPGTGSFKWREMGSTVLVSQLGGDVSVPGPPHASWHHCCSSAQRNGVIGTYISLWFSQNQDSRVVVEKTGWE